MWENKEETTAAKDVFDRIIPAERKLGGLFLCGKLGFVDIKLPSGEVAKSLILMVGVTPSVCFADSSPKGRLYYGNLCAKSFNSPVP